MTRRILLLISLSMVSCKVSGNNEKPLKVKLSLVGQENCRGDSSSVPVVRLKLRLEITNLSDRKLIVWKGIGTAWYGYILAKNEQTLAADIYEENPNIDWVVSESDRRSPPSEAPSTEFTILDHDKSFEVRSNVYLAAYPHDALLGNHVIQLNVGTWPHVSAPEQFRDSWRNYGALVYEPVKSESLRFRVPPETLFTNCAVSVEAQ